MEQSQDLQALINAFLGYRDLLAPVLDSMSEFINTYDGLRADIDTLNQAFAGDVKGKLEQISSTLAQQAARSTDLASQIDRFVTMGDKYVAQVSSLTETLGKVEAGMRTVNELEKSADQQLQKLDAIIQEKRNNYNLRDLQRSLDNYNNSVQKVSDFINKDVGKALQDSNGRLDAIRSQNEVLLKELGREQQDVTALLGEYRANNALLTKLTEQKDVDEAYLFDLLDKWAASRGVKRKK